LFLVKSNRKSLGNDLLLILSSPPPSSSPLKGEEIRKGLVSPQGGGNKRKINSFLKSSRRKNKRKFNPDLKS